MKNLIKKIFSTKGKFDRRPSTNISQATISRGVSYSIKKYGKTYKLLEEYDRQNLSDPTVLAESGTVSKDIRDFQRSI